LSEVSTKSFFIFLKMTKQEQYKEKMRNIFSPQIVQQIKDRLDLVKFVSRYVQLDRNLKATCPFHSEKTPSFSVHPKKQIWRCFGACGLHGDIFTFVQLIEKLSFSEAIKLLANEAGIAFPKSERFKEYLARNWEVKKELLDHLKLYRWHLKQAELNREDALRLERKQLPPKGRWNSWDAKDFLKEQVIDYKFDHLRKKVKYFIEKLEHKAEEIRKNG